MAQEWNNYNSLNMVAPYGGVYYVDLTSGVDTRSGKTWITALKTIQAAIDKAIEGKGTYIYVTGSATLTTSIFCNKTNVHIYGVPEMDNHTGGNCSLTYAVDDSPMFLLSKTKLRFENLRMTLGNTKTVGFSVFDNEADTSAAVALSNSMFKNINILKSAGSNGEGNGFRLGNVTACTFDNIKIVATASHYLLGGFLFTGTTRSNLLNIYIGNCAGTGIYDPGSVDTVYENITVLPSVLVSTDIAGTTSILRDSRLLGTSAYGGNTSILCIGNLTEVD
jgi:hypothetical protein